jgi:membrane-associated phospholipid phosphatase
MLMIGLRLMCCCLLVAAVSPAARVSAQEYLCASEVTAIALGSAAAGVGGTHLRQVDSSRASLLTGPILFDRTVERWIAGDSPTPGQTNFFDSDLGGALTPIAVSAILFVANLSWPTGDAWQDASQDLFISSMGLIANKGINDAVKGIVARPRPYVRLEQGMRIQRPHSNYTYDHNSFYSGHASSSFFITTYADKRLRTLMRHEMTSAQYDSWKWLPSLALYGWASYVGLSRIHALKHHATDVIMGAVVGTLVAQLYYAFGQHTHDPGADTVPSVTLRFSF